LAAVERALTSLDEIRRPCRLMPACGRSPAEAIRGNEGMIRWDTYYIRNRSLWRDTVTLIPATRGVPMGGGARRSRF